ncbi:hypothetical protein N7497_004792 [Penicillium chrysogenum]|nr:hypothetical protein N7497_004792 [Penicillium chrysogenum]
MRTGPSCPFYTSGNSLRRSTRTQYKKAGSLNRGEKLPYSKRVGRGHLNLPGVTQGLRLFGSPQDPAIPGQTGVPPILLPKLHDRLEPPLPHRMAQLTLQAQPRVPHSLRLSISPAEQQTCPPLAGNRMLLWIDPIQEIRPIHGNGILVSARMVDLLRT